jgi:hypothetical protein
LAGQPAKGLFEHGRSIYSTTPSAMLPATKSAA